MQQRQQLAAQGLRPPTGAVALKIQQVDRLPASQPPPQQRGGSTHKRRHRGAQREVAARQRVPRLQRGVERRQQVPGIV